jgi:signal transduction histidine kinase
MINQLLTLARAESGEVQIAKEKINVSAMAESLTEQLEPVATSKDITLTWNCEPNVMAIGDSSWVERILLNLIDNAVKFTQSGGHANVRVSRDDHSAIVEVSDDGPGIMPDALPHIFERFYRADPSRSDRAGAGLGLSLVKWAVDQHSGTVKVDSTPGLGSRFTVRLPAA